MTINWLSISSAAFPQQNCRSVHPLDTFLSARWTFFPLDWIACEMKNHSSSSNIYCDPPPPSNTACIFICLFTLLISVFTRRKKSLEVCEQIASNLTAIKLQFYHTQSPQSAAELPRFRESPQRRQFSSPVFPEEAAFHCATFVWRWPKGNNTANLLHLHILQLFSH